MSLSGTSRGVTTPDMQTPAHQRQEQRTGGTRNKGEGLAFIEERRGLGRVVLEESS